MKIRSALAVALATFGAITLTALPAAASVEAYCGMVVTDANTTVTLSADLDCSTPGDGGPPGPLSWPTPAITVAASGVTVDLGGHTLTGHSFYDAVGILVESEKGGSILNGTISGYDNAIQIESAYGVTVTGVRIKEWGHAGVNVSNSAQVSLTDLVIVGLNLWWNDDFYAGIYVHGSHDVTVSRVDESLSGCVGIEFTGSHDFTLSDSTFKTDEAESVALFGALSNGVVRNVTIGGSGTGVLMVGIPDPGAGVTSVALDGLSISGLDRRVPVGPVNTAGVTMTRVHNVTASSVDVSDASYGFLVHSGSQNVTIAASTAVRNFSYGFGVADPAGVTSAGLTLHDNKAAGNGGSGFVFNRVAVDSARNESNRNHIAGFQWLGGATGRSRSDLAKSNGGNGFLVNNPPGTSVAISDATASNNGASGLNVANGTVNASGGDFSRNTLDGAIDTAGTLRIARATANLNGASGVYFASASAGSADQIRAAGNHEYGLAFQAGTAATDRGGHALSGNGLANLCRGLCLA